MELDELKNTWTSLDERLKKQEVLKENIMREILYTKSGKSLNRLINYTYFGVIICIVAFIPVINTFTSAYFGSFKTMIFILVFLLLLIGLIMGIYNLVLLHKVDFTNNVSWNIRLMQGYNLRVKKQMLPLYILAVIIILLAVIAGIMSPNMELWRWVVVIAAIPVAAVGAYWEYKRMYKANIASILKSLDELKELEEPE